MSISIENLSDDDINELLDEIDKESDKPQLYKQPSEPIFTSTKRKLNRRLTFSALQNSVFAQLNEQDHIEQERVTWHKLKQWVEFEWFDKLYRDNNIKQHYLNDIKEAKIDYKSYTDKILIKYFKCPFKANKSNQCAQAFITNKTNDDAFTLFNFPYYFAKGLHHYVLFSRYDIIHTLGSKQIKRLISNYIEDQQYNILSNTDNKEYEFIYYEERDKLSFFCTEQYEFEKKERTPLLSELVNETIIPNIIHIFIMVKSDYRVYLGINNATWANESFLWAEACAIIKSKDIEKFGREEKWLRKYIQDINKRKKGSNKEEKEEKEIKKEIGFNSIRDKILIKEFKCKSLITENNKLKAIVDESTPRLLWTENLYPYFYQDGIEHNLIWYLDEKVEKDVLEAFIEKNIGDKMYIYWENPPHLKSIPDLNHYQIISVDMNEYMANIKHLKYANKAYKWDTFINNDDIVNKHQSDVEYGWDERVCRRYLEEIEETKIRFNSLIDADLRRYFKCKLKKDDKGILAIDNDYNNYADYDYKKYVFVLDRYPFHLEEGLIQYILIVRDKEKWNQKKIKQIIKAELGADLKENTSDKYVFWEKVQKEKESANLWYYHVIYNDIICEVH